MCNVQVLHCFLINNIERKITKCCLVNEENIVFIILLVNGAKSPAHDMSSDCIATAYVIEKLLLKQFLQQWRLVSRFGQFQQLLKTRVIFNDYSTKAPWKRSAR